MEPIFPPISTPPAGEPGGTAQRRRGVLLAVAALAGATALGAGVAAGVGSAVGGGGRATTTEAAPASQPAALATEALDVSAIYEQASRGVVEIEVGGGGFGFGRGRTEGTGSGFVIDDQGHIVTNQHVVEGAESVTVLFSDGSRAEATVVGTDPGTDIAVLKVDAAASELEALPLGDSSSVKPGQAVVAIGSPFGLEGTVTAGIVSAVGRTIQAPDGSAIAGAIQTDAAINKGNSGGPLLDASGRVIGVNAQIESGGGGSDGVGFAIPISTAQSVARQLIAGQAVQHAYLGVQVEALTAAEAEELGVSAGVRLAAVEGGTPAAQAGLAAGDVVVSIDGAAVSSPESLQAAIAARAPGDEVRLEIVRDRERRTVTATLGSRPS